MKVIRRSHAHTRIQEARPRSPAIGHSTRIFAIALVVSLTACSPLRSALSPIRTLLDPPRYGGVYRILTPGNAATLDPAAANGVEDWWASGALLFNRLYSYDAEGRLYPDLAEDFPSVSPDGLTQAIKLRAGVKFHNGRELTADDVKFTFERVLDPRVGSWGATALQHVVGADEVVGGLTRSLAGMRVLDSHTFEIELRKPLAAFTPMLSLSALSIVPRDEVQAAGNDWGRTVVIGTGPFKLAEWESGRRLRLVRHDAFFRSGLPYLDEVQIEFRIPAPAALQRWKDGAAEFARFEEATEEYNRMLNDAVLAPHVRRSATGWISDRVAFNLENQYARDNRVRAAVAAAINRAALAVHTGDAANTGGVIAPLLPQHDPDFKGGVVYDPAHARALLVEAGYPDGISEFVIAAREWATPLDSIVADLKAIGVEARIEMADPLLPRADDDMRRVAMAYYDQRLDFADAFAEFERFAVCTDEPGLPAFNRCDVRIGAMLDQAERLPLDSAARSAIYREIESAITHDMNPIVLTWKRLTGLGSDRVNGDVLHPLYGLPDLERAWKRQP